MENIYTALRERLDNISTGFPGTENGIELDILRKLFSREEAGLFLSLSPLPEKPVDIAGRLGQDPVELEQRLENMAGKGLLFRIHTEDGNCFLTPPFSMGILEFQIDRMDREFAEMAETYYGAGFGQTLQSNPTGLKRTIQVNRGLVVEYPVVPYNDAVHIIDSQETIVVADCVCRVMGEMNGAGCAKPREACLCFGWFADYYVENGTGRYIEKAEAKNILKQSEQAGLVVQVSNSQMPGSMCACCACCCIMLRSLKMQPSPAASSGSHYFAEIDMESCTGCETCLARCQMGAIEITDNTAGIDRGQCIGCGLCVSTCETESLRLRRKQEDEQYLPPATDFEMYLSIQKERGKI